MWSGIIWVTLGDISKNNIRMSQNLRILTRSVKIHPSLPKPCLNHSLKPSPNPSLNPSPNSNLNPSLSPSLNPNLSHSLSHSLSPNLNICYSIIHCFPAKFWQNLEQINSAKVESNLRPQALYNWPQQSLIPIQLC